MVKDNIGLDWTGMCIQQLSFSMEDIQLSDSYVQGFFVIFI